MPLEFWWSSSATQFDEHMHILQRPYASLDQEKATDYKLQKISIDDSVQKAVPQQQDLFCIFTERFSHDQAMVSLLAFLMELKVRALAFQSSRTGSSEVNHVHGCRAPLSGISSSPGATKSNISCN